MKYSSSFRFLWLGQSFANLGDVLYIVALITMIYQLTGSATYMALIPFFVTVSQFISGMLAPLVIDRFSLRGILAYSQTGKAILLCLLAMLVVFYFPEFNIALVFMIVFFISFLDGWATPVRNAMIPRLVAKDDLVHANSFLSILDQTIRLGGWSMGGMLLVLLGSDQVVFLTVGLYVMASFLMFFIKERDISVGEILEETAPSKTNWTKVREGWLFIWRAPAVRTLTVMSVIEALASAVWVAAIVYIFVEEVLKVGEQWWGYINASFFLGLIIGGMMSLRGSKLLNQRLPSVIVWGTFSTSLLTFLFALNMLTWMALFLSLVIGLTEQIKGIAHQTTIQKSVNDHQLPKVYSAQYALELLTFGVSVLLLGVLTDMWGVRMAFILASCFLFLSFSFSILNQKHLKGAN
ncbi:MFS transporter [Alkalihalophilus sp. As8PL]|uniref:MFS transporter n=1 Tax=Alkalihalophilus sp. As8PL TaxID=3237103 RepID=A0AB39BV54_9BACI